MKLITGKEEESSYIFAACRHQQFAGVIIEKWAIDR